MIWVLGKGTIKPLDSRDLWERWCQGEELLLRAKLLTAWLEQQAKASGEPQ